MEYDITKKEVPASVNNLWTDARERLLKEGQTSQQKENLLLEFYQKFLNKVKALGTNDLPPSLAHALKLAEASIEQVDRDATHAEYLKNLLSGNLDGLR